MGNAGGTAATFRQDRLRCKCRLEPSVPTMELYGCLKLSRTSNQANRSRRTRHSSNHRRETPTLIAALGKC